MNPPVFPKEFEPVILLHRVEGPINLGSVCRAMANTGCGRLRFSGILDSSHPEARKYALHAAPILDEAKKCVDLVDLLRDIDVVFGFSPRNPWNDGRGLDMDTFLQSTYDAVRFGKSVGFLFGNEAHGLDNGALAMCHFRVALPADPKYVSLNLAQAVMVVLWEVHRRKHADIEEDPMVNPERSTPEEKRIFLKRLREYLLAIEYLNEQNPEHIWREVASLFRQRDWTKREMNLLMSVIHKGQSRYQSALRTRDQKTTPHRK